MQTIDLVEHVPIPVRLNPDAVRGLSRFSPTILKIQPTRRRDHYRIVSRGWIGSIQTPTHLFHLRPKIPYANWLAMLGDDVPQDVAASAASWATGPTVEEWLLKRFLELLEPIARRGYSTAYRTLFSEGDMLRGKLNLPAQMRSLHRPTLHYEEQQLSRDRPENRIVVSVITKLLEHCVGSEWQRQELARYRLPLVEVPAVEGEVDWQATRRNASGDYVELLQSAEALWRAMLPAVDRTNPDLQSLAFLLPTERIYETYLTRQLGELLSASGRFVAQPRYSFGTPALHLQPDMLFTPEGDPANVQVIDAKWKRLEATPSAGDVHQILAYGGITGATGLHLVYPGDVSMATSYAIAGRTLIVHRFPIEGDVRELAEAMARLSNAITGRQAKGA